MYILEYSEKHRMIRKTEWKNVKRKRMIWREKKARPAAAACWRSARGLFWSYVGQCMLSPCIVCHYKKQVYTNYTNIIIYTWMWCIYVCYALKSSRLRDVAKKLLWKCVGCDFSMLFMKCELKQARKQNAVFFIFAITMPSEQMHATFLRV